MNIFGPLTSIESLTNHHQILTLMARIVEICGTPGVGKSTIFERLESRRKRNSQWGTATNKQPTGNEGWRDFGLRILKDIKTGKKTINPRTGRQENWFECGRRIYRTLKLGRNFVDLYDLKNAGDRFVALYPEYVDACWHNIFFRQARSSKGLDLRFEKAEFIYLIIKKIQILKEKKTEKVMIIDEGLVNMIDRGLHKSTGAEMEREEIHQLLRSMPWPDALVFIDIDVEENVKRIINRPDIRDMHKGLDSEELKKFARKGRERILTAVNFLEENGIPVLYLDASVETAMNAEKIIRFSKALNSEDLVVTSENAVAF